MSRVRKVKKLTKQPRASDYQTLPQRIKWLRTRQHMTQQQLATLARVDEKTVYLLESDNIGSFNVHMDTIRKIAHALGCKVFINIKTKPYPGSTECQLPSLALPPPPKRSGRISETARLQALKHGGSYWRSYRRRPRRKPSIEISDTPDLATVSDKDVAE